MNQNEIKMKRVKNTQDNLEEVFYKCIKLTLPSTNAYYNVIVVGSVTFWCKDKQTDQTYVYTVI